MEEFLDHLKNDLSNIDWPQFLKDDLIKTGLINTIIDLSIYKSGALRLLWCSKFYGSNNLEFYSCMNYKNSCIYDLDGQYIIDFHNEDGTWKLFMDCILKHISDHAKLINYIPTKIQYKSKTIKIKEKKNSGDTNDIEVEIEINENTYDYYMIEDIKGLENCVALLDNKRSEDYKMWYEVGMCLCNCNPSIACFNIWDEFSQSSDKYDKSHCSYLWNYYVAKRDNSNRKVFGSLLELVKKDTSSKKYNKLLESLHEVDKFDIECIDFESDYLMGKDDTIKNRTNIVTQTIYDWVENPDSKCAGIKAPYNTGKTTLNSKLLDEFSKQFEKILMPTYRVTLTDDLHGDLQKQNIHHYHELREIREQRDAAWEDDPNNYGKAAEEYKIKNEQIKERIICQHESLEKVRHIYSDTVRDEYGRQKEFSRKYDLIVIDEIVSLLNHTKSKTVKNNKLAFDILCELCDNAKKILALDGDFDMRAYKFLKFFDKNVKILRNKIKKNKRVFIFTKDEKNFDQMMIDDLNNGKNIVIATMSSKAANDYYEMFKDKYGDKCMLYCATTSDDIKKQLKNVKENWSNLRILIYTPTIESGVNFDLPHFDKIYGIISSHSTSPRAFMQMLSRVRKLTNDNIHIYLNRLRFSERAYFLTYDEANMFMRNRIFNKIEKQILYQNLKSYNDRERPIESNEKYMNLYLEICIYNFVEEVNSREKFFVPYLVHLMKKKGHEVKIDDRKFTINDAKIRDTLTTKIFNAPDIQPEDIDPLIKRQQNYEASEEDKLIVTKFMFKKLWKINNVTEEFMKKYINKPELILNFRYLMQVKNPKPDNTKIDINTENINEKIIEIGDVINKLGFGQTLTDYRIMNRSRSDTEDKIEQLKNINAPMPKELYDEIKLIENHETYKPLIISEEIFRKNMENVINNCGIFVDRNCSLLFNIDGKLLSARSKLNITKKTNVKEITTKAFLRHINIYLRYYGFCIKSCPKYKKINVYESNINKNALPVSNDKIYEKNDEINVVDDNMINNNNASEFDVYESDYEYNIIDNIALIDNNTSELDGFESDYEHNIIYDNKNNEINDNNDNNDNNVLNNDNASELDVYESDYERNIMGDNNKSNDAYDLIFDLDVAEKKTKSRKSIKINFYRLDYYNKIEQYM